MKGIPKLLSIFLATSLLLPSQVLATSNSSESKVPKSTIVINEIESDAPNQGNDWVEITNIGSEEINISGWYLCDDKGIERKQEGKTTALPEGSILKPGEFLVFEETQNFDFGFGKSDTAILYNAADEEMDRYSYTNVAIGTWSRQADGSFGDANATPGAKNESPDTSQPTLPELKKSIILNEINSSPDNWVELMNTGNETLDLSGYELRDNSDDHRWRFPDKSTLKSGEFLIVEADSKGLVYDNQTQTFVEGTFESAIGIGSGDAIRLYDKSGTLLDEYQWTEHASYEGDAFKASYGRYPDGTGSFCLTKETKGLANDRYNPTVVINEIESNGDETDWVEIMNIGTQSIDISNWYLLDNDPIGHKTESTPLPEGTILEPGALYVFDQNKDFTFGLGKEDQAVIYDASGNSVASYEWTSHANGVYARIPDGTGEFQDFSTSTKGKKNKVVNPVVINEVQSNDPNNGPDWVELANPTAENLDISGLVLMDEKDKDPYTISEGTEIPANGFLVIYQDDSGVSGFKFGLGKGDSLRLFENGEEIASTTWPAGTHTNPTWGLYPDINGDTYKNTQEATPGAANKFADIPNVIAWPGSDTVNVFDTTSTFLEDSSGLDFSNGRLYAIDNGTATFWIMDVAEDGTLTFAPGFESGKQVCFRKDSDNINAKGPDTEGITVDENGLVYLASERDNGNKGVNYNTILMVDPNTAGNRLTAQNEWNLTDSLPQVSANMGIEAVEWISNEDLINKLIDQNTGKAYNPSNYPNAVANGLFFVALEDNGHVYAYVLNTDETVQQIADIDTKLGGAMALDYDTYEKMLWVATDDGYGNRMARIAFNGTDTPDITHVLPASGVDTKANNEGFAIADATYTVNGQRPVYRFCDGVISGALTIGSIDCSYSAKNPDIGGNSDPTIPSDNSNGSDPAPDNVSVSSASSASPNTGIATSTNTVLCLVLLTIGLLGALVLKRQRKTQ